MRVLPSSPEKVPSRSGSLHFAQLHGGHVADLERRLADILRGQGGADVDRELHVELLVLQGLDRGIGLDDVPHLLEAVDHHIGARRLEQAGLAQGDAELVHAHPQALRLGHPLRFLLRQPVDLSRLRCGSLGRRSLGGRSLRRGVLVAQGRDQGGHVEVRVAPAAANRVHHALYRV